MYKEPLIHSLLCSEFVELTLRLIGSYEQSFDCAENSPYLLRKRSVLFDQKVRTFSLKSTDYFFCIRKSWNCGITFPHYDLRFWVFYFLLRWGKNRRRTKEALARKKAEGVILYRAQSQKNAPEKYKLADKDVLISELLKNETPLRRIAKFSRLIGMPL